MQRQGAKQAQAPTSHQEQRARAACTATNREVTHVD